MSDADTLAEVIRPDSIEDEDDDDSNDDDLNYNIDDLDCPTPLTSLRQASRFLIV